MDYKLIWTAIENNTSIAIGSLLLVILLIFIRKITDYILTTIDYIRDRFQQTIYYGISVDGQVLINKISKDLAVIREVMGADRSYIFEFHNGSVFASQQHQWKISQTYEEVKPGISQEGYKLQDMPLTLVWAGFLEAIFDQNIRPVDKSIKGLSVVHKEIIPGVRRIEKMPTCKGTCALGKGVLFFNVREMDYKRGQVRQLLESQGIYYMLITPILNDENNLIGLLGLDYCDEDADILNDPDILPCKLCNTSTQIAMAWIQNKELKEKSLKHQKNIWSK